MLDTNIISYLLKSRDMNLIDTFERISVDSTIAVSAITVAELFYGVKKKQSLKLEAAVREFLYPLEKFAFDENAAFVYGELRTILEAKGEVIGAHDMLIAAHAQSMDAVLITNNMRKFERIKDLKLENWCKK